MTFSEWLLSYKMTAPDSAETRDEYTNKMKYLRELSLCESDKKPKEKLKLRNEHEPK